MEESPCGVRTGFGFTDFLYYIAMVLVPLLTGAVGIYPQSILGLVCYGIVILAAVGVMLFYFCTHCPHYTQDEKRLKCMFFWQLPKFFAPRPGPLRAIDKVAALAAPVVLFVFPLAWLAEDPGLLAIYLLSTITFGATMRRYECGRCPFRDCPANRVPPEAKPSSADD
jgi:hypothetical protein